MVNALARYLIETEVKPDNVGSITKQARSIVTEIVELQKELATATGADRVKIQAKLHDKWENLRDSVTKSNEITWEELLKGLDKEGVSRPGGLRPGNFKPTEPREMKVGDGGDWEEGIIEKKLAAKARKSLPASSFVFPRDKRYPIHDISHARNALSRCSGTPDQAKVRAAVYRKYPSLKKKK
jgi:hypothetical protein